MVTRKGEKIKAITGADEFEFESKLESFTDSLIKKGIEYTIETVQGAWLQVYVKYTEVRQIAEDARDEYNLAGEFHRCIECPFFVRPTDGRVKNVRCKHRGCGVTGNGVLTTADTQCCEWLYEKLAAGEVKLLEIG